MRHLIGTGITATILESAIADLTNYVSDPYGFRYMFTILALAWPWIFFMLNTALTSAIVLRIWFVMCIYRCIYLANSRSKAVWSLHWIIKCGLCRTNNCGIIHDYLDSNIIICNHEFNPIHMLYFPDLFLATKCWDSPTRKVATHCKFGIQSVHNYPRYLYALSPCC
jgi:hypothetical protein